MRLSFLAAMLLAFGSSLAAAQPSQIGNHANGLNYQPTQGDVTTREQSVGIAPSARKEKETNDELERLNRQLQNTENNDPQLHPGGAGKVDPNR